MKLSTLVLTFVLIHSSDNKDTECAGSFVACKFFIDIIVSTVNIYHLISIHQQYFGTLTIFLTSHKASALNEFINIDDI